MKDSAHIPPAPLPRGSELAQVPDDDAVRQISLLEVANVLLRWRLLIVILPVVLTVAVVSYALMQPRTYTATTSFLPQSTSGQRSGVAGIAAQFGVAVQGNQPDESPQFYAELVRSRAIIGALVDSSYMTSLHRPARLEEIYGISGPTSAIRREATIARLSAGTTVIASVQTGIVRLGVSTPDPDVSQQIATRFVKLTNDFNLRRRQTRAGAERNFVQERLAVARADLGAAEARLSSFLERNRQLSNAPELRIDHDRLERAVGMQQQVYTTLAQNYEQARIEEVRNIPVITVIEEAARPLRPDSRKMATKALVVLILGFVLAMMIAFLAEFAGRARRNDADDYREFTDLWRAMIRDLRHPFKRMRGLPER